MAQVNFGHNEKMTAESAIMIYANKETAFATVHGVAIDAQGKQSLLPGTALTHATIANLVARFSSNAQVGSFLPANVISVGLDSLVWWVQPTKRAVFFDCDPEDGIGKESAVVPHPGLIFAIRDNKWSVFAVKGCSRPDPSTPLYQAPHFNVWAGGQICVGNVDVPKGYSVETMTVWEDAYFNSVFTHPNIHTPMGLVNYKGGSYAFWRSMLDGKYTEFPEEVLVAQQQTAGDFVNAMNGGQL